MTTIETTEPMSAHANGFQKGYATTALLIDDQVTVGKAVRLLLAGAPDIDLHYCSDPADAIKTANLVKPSVILQDLVMPSVDGIEVVQLIRSNPATAVTPIIVLSSEDNPGVKSRAFAAGANDYLVKLPDKVELIARLRYHSAAYLNQIQRDQAFRNLRESQEQLIAANRRLEEAYAKLDGALRETERHAQEAVQLTELVDVLQSCHTLEEAYTITKTVLPRILQSGSGALCITGSSRNIVEPVATWGQLPSVMKPFTPDSCWALRRGKPHVVHHGNSPLKCTHTSSVENYLCIPLAAQGETLGILYLEGGLQSAGSAEQLKAEMESLSRQAIAAGERISLALANINLREVLRVQSIRDPLTGLFNRRYMEESLERERRRAARNGQSVAVLMLDIDHFKRFNDTLGHLAGDALLRAIGDFLLHRTRGQDVACRFGGEEFAIILSSASVDAADKRAELLRREIKELRVDHEGKALGQISLSIGIAVFPIHASSSNELLQIADQALYRAKAEGRDRVAIGPNS